MAHRPEFVEGACPEPVEGIAYPDGHRPGKKRTAIAQYFYIFLLVFHFFWAISLINNSFRDTKMSKSGTTNENESGFVWERITLWDVRASVNIIILNQELFLPLRSRDSTLETNR
jgi:hypothetical protein